MSSIRTLKLKYIFGGPKDSQDAFLDEFEKIQREQANLIRISYNRAKNGLNEKQLRDEIRNKKYNNVPCQMTKPDIGPAFRKPLMHAIRCMTERFSYVLVLL